MIDLGRGEPVAFGSIIEELLDLIAEDAAALNCVDDVSHAREILKRGTSACRQVEAFNKAKANGADTSEAFIAVVDLIADETIADLP